MPKKSPAARRRKSESRSRKAKAFYARKPPGRGGQKPEDRSQTSDLRSSTPNLRPRSSVFHTLAPSHFTLREDGSVVTGRDGVPPSQTETKSRGQRHAVPPNLIYSSDSPFIRLYHGNCLELLDAIYATYGDAGRFDAIFADPPYFLSNGGITCHAGKMVKVDKGDWDVSRGPELNHEFNTEWLRRCQRVLKPNGTIWVTGTHHVIFSIGYALQQLGFKILNDIAWEKPNPPPNLSCRYFTHSTETVLWAAKNEKSKHVFNYQEMRKVTGKQMKTVWRAKEWGDGLRDKWISGNESETNNPPIQQSTNPAPPADQALASIWTIGAPTTDEKKLGKHPTQKPVALIERCLLASTNEGDLVLDPFLGGGTTAVVSLRLKRGCVGVELDMHHLEIAAKRVDTEIIEIWLRHFRICVEISVCGRDGVPPSQTRWGRQHANPPSQIDLAIFSDSINGSRRMAGVPEIQTERIFHECKFVFLSCAHVEHGAVVHTTVDVSLQEAWAKTPTGKKRETTHIVRCETEIFRVKTV